MEDRKNAFSGKVQVKNRRTNKEHELEVTMPGLDIGHQLTRKKDRPARVNVSLSLGRSVSYGDYSFKITMGGAVDVSEEDFFSGEAHQIVAQHIGDTIIPFIEDLDANWIPEALQIQGRIELIVDRDRA